ncbi:MAG: 2-hydroxyacyl-CoA dehydratase family protein, partial [Vicinamibacterales bacterium]
PILLFDILYSRTPEARAYGVGRTRQFLVDAAAINGRDAADARLGDAIRESNVARAAMRRLLALREGRPRVTGTRALALLGARAFVDCPTYTTLLNRAIAELAPVAPLPGPRLLLLGAPPDDTRLHGFLETLGAVVVAEDGGWGTRGVGRDIAVDGDPFVAIFDKYYDDVPASRTWAAANDAWVASFTQETTDGVVFYLPPEDSVSGWDHPRQRAHFEALHIPSLVIRDDATDPAMMSRWEEPAREFLARLAQAQ